MHYLEAQKMKKIYIKTLDDRELVMLSLVANNIYKYVNCKKLNQIKLYDVKFPVI